MNLIDRIRDKIKEIKKRGDQPSIIWMGKQEKAEFEELIIRGEFKMTDVKDKNKHEIFGLPVEFVSSDEWLTIFIDESED